MSKQVADQRIADRYVLENPIGRGGMGVVWRAQDSLLRRNVAIKEIAIPHAVASDERDSIRQRVLREARAAARLNHANAVTVYDVIENDGNAFIVMELIAGRTLEDIVKQDGPIDPARVADVALAVLGALELAHGEGIVHRDVKPANVMIRPDGRVKLADFGIASVKDDPKIGAPAQDGADVAVPADWTTYEDPDIGHSVRYPAEWGEPSVRSNGTFFTDPDTGTYLQVAYSQPPTAETPEAAWEAYAPTFGARKETYNEIGITPTTFQGMDAATWEYTYVEDGAELHAVDLGFIVPYGDEGTGMALLFQTHAEDWASSQELFEQLKAGFEPPS